MDLVVQAEAVSAHFRCGASGARTVPSISDKG